MKKNLKFKSLKRALKDTSILIELSIHSLSNDKKSRYSSAMTQKIVVNHLRINS